MWLETASVYTEAFFVLKPPEKETPPRGAFGLLPYERGIFRLASAR